MKDLIAVFTYCPDTERKLILLNLLQYIQPVRDKFDLIVVSHSELPNEVKDLSDYSFIEVNNHLITDFSLTNKFWFKTENIFLHSSLVYPFSTHLSIYSLIHYIINFSEFKEYKKVHCIEYDINLDNLNIINEVNNDLDNYDNVMFKSSDDWVHGVYFAFKINNFPLEYFKFNKNFILNNIKNIETRMTEHYTPKFLSVNNRKTNFKSIENISKNLILQKKDSHNNDKLNWCVPIIQKDTNLLYIFIFNEKGGEYNIDVITNINNIHKISNMKSNWDLIPLGNTLEINYIKILVNGIIKTEFLINENNLDSFCENNFFYYL